MERCPKCGKLQYDPIGFCFNCDAKRSNRQKKKLLENRCKRCGKPCDIDGFCDHCDGGRSLYSELRQLYEE